MAVASVPRPAAVAVVLAQFSRWTSARRKSDGKHFYYIPGSTPGVVYMTSVDGCTCPSAQHSRDGNCKHQAAVRQFQGRQQPAPAPKKRASYADLFPACPCGDVADSRDGLCDRCASDREWLQRGASARAS